MPVSPSLGLSPHRLYPYSYYFCGKKGVDCSSLDYPFTQGNRQCDQCTNGPLSHFCWWNRFVANPIKNHGYQGEAQEGPGCAEGAEFRVR